MAMHLFSTPVQCTHCGTVVDDPTLDKCPGCGNLLKERRTPSRVAGVPRRYTQLRILLGVLRFLGVITAAVGVLLFLFGEDGTAWEVRAITLLAAFLLAAVIFVVAALFDVMLDVEENTRATFRVQQQMLEVMQRSPEQGRAARE